MTRNRGCTQKASKTILKGVKQNNIWQKANKKGKNDRNKGKENKAEKRETLLLRFLTRLGWVLGYCTHSNKNDESLSKTHRHKFAHEVCTHHLKNKLVALAASPSLFL